MPWVQRLFCPISLAASTSAAGRNDPSPPTTRDANRSNSTASSLETPMWRRVLCECARASASVRGAVLGSR